MKGKLWFHRGPSYTQTFDDAEAFDVSDVSDIELSAEEFAEHYFDNRDGWEDTWPLDFHVHSGDGTLLGIVKVELESRPYFSGKKRT